MTTQTRLDSLIESIFNVAIGCAIAFVAQLVIFPRVGIHVPMSTNVTISLYFTAISVARSYIVRRWFNGPLHNASLRIAQCLRSLGEWAMVYAVAIRFVVGESFAQVTQFVLDFADALHRLLARRDRFMTHKQIVDDIIANRLSDDDKNRLRSYDREDVAVVYHHTLGRWIRNTYRLWDERNPLTMLNYHPDIREDGADHSERHPDAVSSSIITSVWERLQ